MQITREQWELDVENTKKEIPAYEKLAEGYAILAQLPEQDHNTRSTYHHRSRVAKRDAREASAFLDRLIEFGKEMLGVDANEERQDE